MFVFKNRMIFKMSLIKYLCDRLCLVLLVFCFVISASQAENFNDWKNQQQSGFKQTKDEFEQYRAEINAAFKEYKRQNRCGMG